MVGACVSVGVVNLLVAATWPAVTGGDGVA